MRSALEHRGPCNRRRAAVLAGLVGLMVMVSTGGGQAAHCPAQPYPTTSHFLPPTNLGVLKRQLINYGCFGDYQRDLAREIGFARSFIEARAAAVSKPAVVLDIDETALSNWAVMLANDFGFIPSGPCRIGRGGCGQRAWERSAAAEPIVPMVELVRAAQERDVAVFFITGRPGDPADRAAAIRNLRRAGYHGWTALIMRAPDERRLSARDYKAARRAAIVADGYTIIANVGDQDSDLEGGYAERTFKLPNPFYFIP